MNTGNAICFRVIEDDLDIRIIRFTSHDLAVEASREPAIDAVFHF